MALSDAERQRKRRERLKNESMKPILVRGSNGKFDERIRIALAIKKLANQGRLSDEVIDLIVSASIFDDEDNLTKKYIQRIVLKYLTSNDKE